MFDAHHHTYSSYNLHSADGVVFVWTLDGRISRGIYEIIQNVVTSTVPTYMQGNMCI